MNKFNKTNAPKKEKPPAKPAVKAEDRLIPAPDKTP
jgi:hypothetical protein